MIDEPPSWACWSWGRLCLHGLKVYGNFISHAQGVISKREARASGSLAGTLIPKQTDRGTAEGTALAP